ncbi:holin-associated N-acetylmuramidase [Yoonia sediminilitoris]|uniref:Putative peptidoglycan binding protein n=1 Tax=Yoonia sediminilitoris TaxID=1286148 RepID=A0A2T6KRU6_9RHOB|nr:holin-associated N-acetylmuramidase [Yoonia sediminilitoris]PUB19282.1 putative peptidoglycan binding protein [Yoonia sediminilitoris]RCW99450.1 putative peptidoglycan binding protein [Yoonia sediminilitoris]
MQTVIEIATAIVAREGGYVNDSDDPGGATNFGVTIHTMRRLGIDLTGDDKVTDADVRAMTKDRAVAIFVEHYYERPKIDRLPAPLHASVFDMYVNAGTNAVKILQRLLCDMRIAVVVDGFIGPQTIAATEKALAAAPDHLVDAYGIARRNYYYDLADRRVNSRKYARRRNGGKGGWIRRAEEFISERYHLSDNQHQKRTAKWG